MCYYHRNRPERCEANYSHTKQKVICAVYVLWGKAALPSNICRKQKQQMQVMPENLFLLLRYLTACTWKTKVNATVWVFDITLKIFREKCCLMCSCLRVMCPCINFPLEFMLHGFMRTAFAIHSLGFTYCFVNVILGYQFLWLLFTSLTLW